MKIQQKKYTKKNGWENLENKSLMSEKLSQKANLVLIFGHKDLIKSKKIFEGIQKNYPKAQIISASTAGEIIGTEVNDNSLSLTAIEFEKTKIQTASKKTEKMEDSFTVGQKLMEKLEKKDLKQVMVFSEGINVNGSELVKGLQSKNKKNISITGGLSGDEANFLETYTGLNTQGKKNQVVIIGFYGKFIEIGSGSFGGWDPFGSIRTVTKSKNNIVYELDNEPILDLYQKYLGEKAKELPGSGLLFPLNIQPPKEEKKLTRTLLSIDKKEKSITFAGDVPEGSRAQLMKANFERLIDGAGHAAEMNPIQKGQAQLAILISCVGRKLVLKQRIEEEIESVRGILGKQCQLTGFYAYGEIAPTQKSSQKCALHNQTMTITTFREKID